MAKYDLCIIKWRSHIPRGVLFGFSEHYLDFLSPLKGGLGVSFTRGGALASPRPKKYLHKLLLACRKLFRVCGYIQPHFRNPCPVVVLLVLFFACQNNCFIEYRILMSPEVSSLSIDSIPVENKTSLYLKSGNHAFRIMDKQGHTIYKTYYFKCIQGAYEVFISTEAVMFTEIP